MTALEFTGVTLAHGKRVLADDVSFTLPEGSLTLLTGPNGNGKTTMLRAMLGLHPVTRGRISVFGAPPRGGRGTIGYLPQHRRLPAPQLCGRDLLTAAWRGTRWGLPNFGRTCRRAVDEALSVAGATDLARRPLAVLSGGERQRVFLAEALVNNPSLLILDEPLAGMDTVWQGRVARLLSDLKRTRNLTMLVCTHDLETLMPETDHILHMDGTRCVARDPREGAHV